MFVAPAYAEVISVSSDKSEYFSGDTITISGKVKPNPDIPFVIINILTPAKDNFVSIETVLPNSGGSFSTTFQAGGPTWAGDGTYPIQVNYGTKSEITIKFAKSAPGKTTTETPSTPKKQSEIISNENENPQKIPEEKNQEPKTHIPGFPALDKSPQYYIDRYNNEQNYRDWFDSQFPNQSIASIVGYGTTHIPDFPSLDNSPQYYIDRYNTEKDYRDWFDSQFPNQSLYEVLGFPEPIQVPNWIKITAEWWATGKIRDSDFLEGIEFMIKNNILIVPYMPTPDDIPNQDVPDWIRNTASWWAQDKISEEEFLNAIQFLIKSGIIVV